MTELPETLPCTQLSSECSEIGSVAAFDELVTTERTDDHIVIQGVDLRSRNDTILSNDWTHTVFLGCQLTPEAEAYLARTGATIFPPFDNLPYQPYRGALYTPAELREGDLDLHIYEHQARWREKPPAPILEALAQRIHDHAVDTALHSYLANHDKVVAIMGGHSLHRDHKTYRTVAAVARSLARADHLVVTGGGPGAMEAGNLGAWLAPQPDDALDVAIAILSEEVDYSTTKYRELGIKVAEKFPGGSSSLAIPTWFYGHEPTNDFATDVAKYFSNSIREDGLLAIATHGVVYTPGAAGTIQEVFMDATQNHYAVFDIISPMVFVDADYWADDRLGAPKLLRQLAGDRPYGKMIAVLDDPDEVVDFITENPPIRTGV